MGGPIGYWTRSGATVNATACGEYAVAALIKLIFKPCIRLARGVIWFAIWLIYYIVCLAGFTSQTPANVTVDVTTQRYDNARTGGNYFEKILNTSNVSPARFGKLFTRTVDDDVYAQPLYLHDVFLPNPAIEGRYRLISRWIMGYDSTTLFERLVIGWNKPIEYLARSTQL
jgi:hypothetical protein